MRPRSRRGWVLAAATLLVGGLLLLGLLAAIGWSAYWVDVVPGGDAGLATSSELEAGRLAMSLCGGVLLALGLATAAVLVLRHRGVQG